MKYMISIFNLIYHSLNKKAISLNSKYTVLVTKKPQLRGFPVYINIFLFKNNDL